MGRKIDMLGKRFGRLVVIEEAPSRNNKAMWVCKCECGNITHPVGGGDLRSGKVSSCGCLHNELLSATMKKHGQKNTRLYRIWQNMKNRCRNSNVPCFDVYGGRGIKVCKEWDEDFMSFYNWAMDNGYNDNLTIDRIDVNGDYCPENCKWSTTKEQSNNLRKNVIVEINGEKHTLAEWSQISGIKYFTIYQRYLRGWSGSHLLDQVVKNI